MFLSFLQYQSIPVVVICTSLGTLQYVSHVFNGANLLEASKQIPAKRHRAPNVVASLTDSIFVCLRDGSQCQTL